MACGTVLAIAFAAKSSRADVPISAESRAHFAAGVNMLKDPEAPRYEDAYREFTAAYAASPSSKILGNLGLCAMKLERDEEAVAAYDKYLAESKDLKPSEVQQVSADLATLRAGLVHVTVDSDPPGARLVDVRLPVRGEKITNAYGPIVQSTGLGLHAGSHQITAKLEGYPDQTWEFEASAGQTLPQHPFVFTKPVASILPSAPPPVTAEPMPVVVIKRPLTPGFWIGVTATGALTVATVVTGVLALGKHSQFVTDNNGQDPTEAQSVKSSGQTLNVINDACFGGAIAAAVVTTILYFSRPAVEVAATPSVRRNAKTRVQLTPTLGWAAGGLSLQGNF